MEYLFGLAIVAVVAIVAIAKGSPMTAEVTTTKAKLGIK